MNGFYYLFSAYYIIFKYYLIFNTEFNIFLNINKIHKINIISKHLKQFVSGVNIRDGEILILK